jgi:hypothetical protein
MVLFFPSVTTAHNPTKPGEDQEDQDSDVLDLLFEYTSYDLPQRISNFFGFATCGVLNCWAGGAVVGGQHTNWHGNVPSHSSHDILCVRVLTETNIAVSF